MNDGSEPIELPAIGDKVLVNITPSVRSEEKWFQVGVVLTVRHDPTDLICATIQITQPVGAEANLNGCRSDDTWTGCVVSSIYDKYRNHWRATCPVSDLAKAVWSKCWENDSGN